MKKIHVILAILLFYHTVKCQDFFSLVSPFLGSAQTGTDNGRSLIQEFVKLGTDIGQIVLHNQNSQSKSQSFQALLPRLSTSIPQIATTRMIVVTPFSTSTDGKHNYFAKDFHGTARALPSPLGHFPPNNVPHSLEILKNQLYFGQQQQRQQQQQQQQQPRTSTRQILQFHRNAQPQQQSLARFQAVQPVSIDAIKGSINFGQEVTRLLGEITQYSDVHRQQNQDYGSVQKLLNIFFNSMSSGQSDNTRGQQLRPLNDGTEIGRNRPFAKNLFESDIVLTVAQMKGIVMDGKEERMGNLRRRNRRKVITGSVYRWPKNNNIPYEFASSDGSFLFP